MSDSGAQHPVPMQTPTVLQITKQHGDGWDVRRITAEGVRAVVSKSTSDLPVAAEIASVAPRGEACADSARMPGSTEVGDTLIFLQTGPVLSPSNVREVAALAGQEPLHGAGHAAVLAVEHGALTDLLCKVPCRVRNISKATQVQIKGVEDVIRLLGVLRRRASTSRVSRDQTLVLNISVPENQAVLRLIHVPLSVWGSSGAAQSRTGAAIASLLRVTGVLAEASATLLAAQCLQGPTYSRPALQQRVPCTAQTRTSSTRFHVPFRDCILGQLLRPGLLSFRGARLVVLCPPSECELPSAFLSFLAHVIPLLPLAPFVGGSAACTLDLYSPPVAETAAHSLLSHATLREWLFSGRAPIGTSNQGEGHLAATNSTTLPDSPRSSSGSQHSSAPPASHSGTPKEPLLQPIHYPRPVSSPLRMPSMQPLSQQRLSPPVMRSVVRALFGSASSSPRHLRAANDARTGKQSESCQGTLDSQSLPALGSPLVNMVFTAAARVHEVCKRLDVTDGSSVAALQAGEEEQSTHT